MPDESRYDLAFRPHSYWRPGTLRSHFGSRIKGELRRKFVKEHVEDEALPASLLRSGLTEDEQLSSGRFHPWGMGGEFLPDLADGEVEIARVVLKSTTMDVTSIRARRKGGAIRYSIVDEYPENELNFVVEPSRTDAPLTLGDLIHMIDHALEGGGLVHVHRDWHYAEGGCQPEEIYDFATASSEFYPDLSRWYDDANEQWLEARRREQAAEADLKPEDGEE